MAAPVASFPSAALPGIFSRPRLPWPPAIASGAHSPLCVRVCSNVRWRGSVSLSSGALAGGCGRAVSNGTSTAENTPPLPLASLFPRRTAFVRMSLPSPCLPTPCLPSPCLPSQLSRPSMPLQSPLSLSLHHHSSPNSPVPPLLPPSDCAHSARIQPRMRKYAQAHTHTRTHDARTLHASIHQARQRARLRRRTHLWTLKGEERAAEQVEVHTWVT